MRKKAEFLIIQPKDAFEIESQKTLPGWVCALLCTGPQILHYLELWLGTLLCSVKLKHSPFLSPLGRLGFRKCPKQVERGPLSK